MPAPRSGCRAVQTFTFRPMTRLAYQQCEQDMERPGMPGTSVSAI